VLRDLAYGLYSRKLRRELSGVSLPRHVLLYEQADGGGTLTGLAETLTTDDIARHLYTAGQPEPDLVIRTSGEQRVSNFLLWQTVHSELYFCDAYWPAFREIDFLRALRSYAARQSRRGA
jgi:short-chain Z-isoprenyl diphosphate synthase